MSLPTSAYAVHSETTPLTPWNLERREPGACDVLIDIQFCGVCHTDIHFARGEWGNSIYPMVPGHEIVGKVARVGSDVTRWAVGDTVGVGCFVDSCRSCAACTTGEEQFCESGATFTYNAPEKGGAGTTYGGYSTQIVVDENYVVRVPDAIPLDAAAPLLCAGITTYSPLRRFDVKAGKRVGVVGLGGLGHMAVKFAKSMGAHVTVMSHSPGKKQDALDLGADAFFDTSVADAFEGHEGRYDLLLDTVSAAHDLNAYLGLLKLGGNMVLVGLPDPRRRIPAGVPAPFALGLAHRRHRGDAGDARLLRRARHRVRHRSDPDVGDQRGLRANAEERRAVPVRDRHGQFEVELVAPVQLA